MAESKPCKACAEEIKLAARVCPHCRQSQSAQWARSPLIALPVGVLVFFVTLSILMPDRTVFTPGEDLREHQSEIAVRDSSFEFGDCDDCKGSLQITTVGMLDNRGMHGWEDLQFEVRYFDAAGALIDTIATTSYSLVLPAGGEAAFRVKGAAAKARSSYQSHQVLVTNADDLGAWP